jgi:uncharacterized coiled-coil DUF342 family protein
MESASGNVEEVKMNIIEREPDSANTAGPALQTDQPNPQIGGEDLPDYREDSPDEFGRISMELSDAKLKLKQREREVGDLTRRWIEVSSDLDRTQDLLVVTQKRLLEVMEERDEYEDERDRLEEDFLNHRGREAALREDVASFEQRLRQTQADLQQAQDRETELAGQLEVEQEDNPLASDLQDELSAHLIESEKLNDELLAVRAERNVATERVETAKREVRYLNGKLEAAEKEVRDLKDKLGAAEKEVRDLKDKLGTVRRDESSNNAAQARVVQDKDRQIKDLIQVRDNLRAEVILRGGDVVGSLGEVTRERYNPARWEEAGRREREGLQRIFREEWGPEGYGNLPREEWPPEYQPGVPLQNDFNYLAVVEKTNRGDTAEKKLEELTTKVHETFERINTLFPEQKYTGEETITDLDRLVDYFASTKARIDQANEEIQNLRRASDGAVSGVKGLIETEIRHLDDLEDPTSVKVEGEHDLEPSPPPTQKHGRSKLTPENESSAQLPLPSDDTSLPGVQRLDVTTQDEYPREEGQSSQEGVTSDDNVARREDDAPPQDNDLVDNISSPQSVHQPLETPGTKTGPDMAELEPSYPSITDKAPIENESLVAQPSFHEPDDIPVKAHYRDIGTQSDLNELESPSGHDEAASQENTKAGIHQSEAQPLHIPKSVSAPGEGQPISSAGVPHAPARRRTRPIGTAPTRTSTRTTRNPAPVYTIPSQGKKRKATESAEGEPSKKK